MINKFALINTALFLLVKSAGATVLLNDSFDYTNGPLVTTSGGTWTHHSGAVIGQVQVVSGRMLLNGTDTEDVSAGLAGQPYDPDGATNRFYAGFTVRFTSLPSPGGTYFAMFKDASSGFRARIWALTGGAAAGKFRLGISSTSSSINAIYPADLSLNTDYTVVTRLVNSNSVAKLWIDPTAESDPAISTSDGVSGFTVAAYAARQNSGEGALSLDDLRVGTAFTDVITNALPLQGPEIAAPPFNQSVLEGASATFSVTVNGTPPPDYQWRFNGTNLPGAVGPVLSISNATFAQSGFYSVQVLNVIDETASEPVVLNVFSGAAPAFSLLTYNLHGNGVLNWSTNTSHVQAIGREVQYLDPDIITFQEVPVTNNGTAQMTNFVAAFRPGYYLATNSTDDGFIRSVILSRFPILNSTSRLHGADLTSFGYSDSGFTRDLFEAEISVPHFPQPLHVFTVHLKSGQQTDEALKRSAEAAAISNFFVTTYLPAHGLEPYVLTGDMNEDIVRPPASDPQSIQRLASAAAGLELTTPFNPITRSELTHSIQSTGGLSHRYDYILPTALLFSNVTGSLPFRSDLLNPLPAGLKSNDSVIGSDHLPVWMSFGNPYEKPFRLLSIARSNETLALIWESVPGQPYQAQSTSNLRDWTTLASNLTATGSVSVYTTGITGTARFFQIRRE